VSDRRLPLLILSIMVVLTAGAIVAGLLLAPEPDTLTVQNAAGENLLAPSLSVLVVANQSASAGGQTQSQPPIRQEFTFDPSVTPDTNTPAGVDASVVLNILHRIVQSEPWVSGPITYRYTGSVAMLLGIPPTTSSNGLTVSLQTSGTAHSWVSSGYLGAFYVRFTIKVGPVTRKASELVQFKKIGDYKPTPSHLPTA
jgi:hypothetical protein